MTKAQIIERVSEQITTLTKRQAEVVVNTIFDCVRDSLKNGDKTEIRGFGSFRLRDERRAEPQDRRDRGGPCQEGPIFQSRQGIEGTPEPVITERSS